MIALVRCFVIPVLIILSTPAFSQQYTSWSSEYLPSERADQLSVCTAGVYYSDGFFMMRLYDDNLDFLFNNNQLTLPYGEVLGRALLVIDGQSYELIAETFPRGRDDALPSTQTMALYYQYDDFDNLVNALRWGGAARIVFPNQTYYTFTLNGSNNAIMAAFNCWERNYTGEPNNNPFEGAPNQTPQQGGNPFSNL
jgi:hypothetical protein